jgi:hypothetical protein
MTGEVKNFFFDSPAARSFSYQLFAIKTKNPDCQRTAPASLKPAGKSARFAALKNAVSGI